MKREFDKQEVGSEGEQLAFDFLIAKGLRPVLRNYRCKGGEIDLVMLDGATLALVEVRVRQDRDYGGAAASVTLTKQRKIIIAAKHLLLTHKHLNRYRARFDVVAIEHAAHIDWIKDAFRIGR